MNTKKEKLATATTAADVMPKGKTPHVEGNAGFNFAKPATNMSGKIDFGPALALDVITANIPPQVQKVMNEWLALGGGALDIQAINDSLITKGLWVRASGAPYNQDVATILLHYRDRLLGKAAWGKGNNAVTVQLATFS
tara:strand:- start:468 stop:884 length:417 start_codon:yes stop_codon:yes gene_type:complete